MSNKRKVTARQLLDLLESIVGGDFLEEIGMCVLGDDAKPAKSSAKPMRD